MLEQPDKSNDPDKHMGFNEEGLYGSDIDVNFANEIANHAIEKEHIDP
jgi:hypothetical protein